MHRPLTALLLVGVALGAGATSARAEGGPALTLAGAVERGLEHNLGLRVSAYDIDAAREDVARLNAEFAVLLDATAAFAHQNNASFLDVTQFQRTVAPSLEVGASKRFGLGTQLRLSVQTLYQDQNDIEIAGGFRIRAQNRFNLAFGFEATQPLLRGFGTETNLAAVESAQRAITLEQLQRRQQASELAKNIEAAYWTAALADQTVQIRKLSLKLAGDELEITRARVEAGEQPTLAVLQVEAAVASREEQLLTAKQERQDRIDQLNLLLGTADQASARGAAIASKPTERVPDAVLSNPDAAVRRGFEQNPDIKALQQGRRVQEAQEEATENATLPGLDLFGSATYSPFLARDVEDTQTGRTSDEWATEQFNYAVGLRFNYPLGNEGAEASLRKLRVELARTDTQIELLKRNTATSVRSALGRVDSGRERVRVARVAVKLRERSLEAAEARYRAGLAIVKDVLDEQEAVEEARLSEQQAIAAYLISLSDAEHLTGLLLDRWNIDL